MIKICVITAVWKRYKLTKFFLEHLLEIKNILKNDYEIHIVVAGSEEYYETLYYETKYKLCKCTK